MPFAPKKILVPMDAEDASFWAWFQARDLAVRFGASIEVLHVQDLMPEGTMGYYHSRVTEWIRERTLEKIRAHIGDAARIRVVEGDPVTRILHAALRGRFDLIVSGTRARTGLFRLLNGSVAEGVAQLSPVPLWAVKRKPRPVRSVLAPVALDDRARLGLALAAQAAEALGASLRLLHVAPPGSDRAALRAALARWVAELPAQTRKATAPRVTVSLGDPVARIVEAASRHPLVALVAHRRMIFKESVLGTTAERVLRHAGPSVLCLPVSPPSPRRRKKSAEALIR